jgi:hypothetical protein
MFVKTRQSLEQIRDVRSDRVARASVVRACCRDVIPLLDLRSRRSCLCWQCSADANHAVRCCDIIGGHALRPKSRHIEPLCHERLLHVGIRLGGAALATLARAVAPGIAGLLMTGGSLAVPLFVGAGMKIVYDLALWRAFRGLRPPEERP